MDASESKENELTELSYKQAIPQLQKLVTLIKLRPLIKISLYNSKFLKLIFTEA